MQSLVSNLSPVTMTPAIICRADVVYIGEQLIAGVFDTGVYALSIASDV